MRKRKRSVVGRDPRSFISSYKPLAGIFHAREYISRHRDAPLTSRAQIVFDAIVIVVIVACGLMIFFAARG